MSVGVVVLDVFMSVVSKLGNDLHADSNRTMLWSDDDNTQWAALAQVLETIFAEHFDLSMEVFGGIQLWHIHLMI